ncbi:transglutaminase domain-containing protein [Breznakiellaceae bacterium SP9]
MKQRGSFAATHKPSIVVRDNAAGLASPDRRLMLSLLFRSLALFIILYQFNFLADDLSDSTAFIAIVLAAFALPFGLFRLRLHPLIAASALAASPWVFRLLITVPRFFVEGSAIGLDSLLLNLDRNYFVALLPFYWAAFATYFAIRSRVFLRAEIIAADVLLLVLFSIASTDTIAAYRWPIMLIMVFAVVVLFQLMAVILSIPPELRMRRSEALFAALSVLVLVVLGGIAFIGTAQEGAVTKGGGLLEPKIFQFDFSKLLTLESEISMNDDLVLIVKKDAEDEHIYMRRFVISEYDKAKGFYHNEIVDEASQPEVLPNQKTIFAGGTLPITLSSATSEARIYYTLDGSLPTRESTLYTDAFSVSVGTTLNAIAVKEGLSDSAVLTADFAQLRNGTVHPSFPSAPRIASVAAPTAQVLFEQDRMRNITEQEYYMVNIDSGAFIGMNAPVSVTPFETWDASSFKSAYSVESLTSIASDLDLMDIRLYHYDAAAFDMSPEEYTLYTQFGNDQRVQDLALKLTEGFTDYWDTIQIIYEYLKYGEFRYSMKPGLAADGDQLHYFLFQSKRGYCTYYAFAFTLLLRSLGIPARVAAGFFLDPDSGAFNYYPVRTDMAHAWVEVYYPEYGWIEYDPTTENLAEGEEFRLSSGVPPELFERLMKEILENHSLLRAKEGTDEDDPARVWQNAMHTAGRLIRRYWLIALTGILAILFLGMRTGCLIRSKLSFDERKKSQWLWKHLLKRLALAGFKRGPAEAEAEWVHGLSQGEQGLPTLLPCYQNYQAARFAQTYLTEDYRRMQDNYLAFSLNYKRFVSLQRRALTWLFPPLALALRSTVPSPLRKGLSVLLLVGLIGVLGGEQAGAQNPLPSAQTMYTEALDAMQKENWERAIELLTMGKKYYADDARFPWNLGDLYFNRKLYRLAWDEYQKAERLMPYDISLLLQLSRTAGYLNEDQVSARYLEEVLRINPNNNEAIGTLGWMYYKIHRLKDGEQLLKSAIDRLGPSSDFSMTLGTIYADMFDYAEGKRWYMAAITESEQVGDTLFAAVARYNLSIHESRFYQFDLALAQTRASINALNRASGHLALGELYVRRLDIGAGVSEYETAYEMDTSPLSKVNLSQTYQLAGRLEEARLYAQECLDMSDLSWMMNYGIDPVRYKRDLHEILYKTYEGLANTESLSPYSAIGDKANSLVRRIEYTFKAHVHKQLYRKYSLESANAYNAEDNENGEHLDALIQYFKAFESYPSRAFTYLDKARRFEEPLIPQSGPSYNYEEGNLLGDRSLLQETLDYFNPQWERDMLAESYRSIAIDAKKAGAKTELFDAIERLFALNNGAIRQHGFSLPIELQIDFSETHAASERSIRRMIERSGFEVLEETPSFWDSIFGSGSDDKEAQWNPRYRLRINVYEKEAAFELRDNNRGVNLSRKVLPLLSSSSEDLSAFARALAEEVFTNTR